MTCGWSVARLLVGCVTAATIAAGASACSSVHTEEGELTYSNPATLVGVIGCIGYNARSPVQHANAHGSCIYQGQRIDVYTFDNDEERNTWLTSVGAIGATPGSTHVWFGDGDSWVLSGHAPGAVAAATAAAGGQAVA